MRRQTQRRVTFIPRAVGILGYTSILLSLLLLHVLDTAQVENMPLVGSFSGKMQASQATSTPGPNTDWPHPFIHVVNTRFQQEQPDLAALGRARLVLFETFCLGSILGQTLMRKKHAVPPFLWIIKIDPHLVKELRNCLVSLVKGYPFVYVVASNVNFGVGQKAGGWRGGQAGADILSSNVFTGNITLLERAQSARTSRAILETRVDADDGLHTEYLEGVQEDAKEKLFWLWNQSNPARQRWRYWCSLAHLDWNPTPNSILVTSPNVFGVFAPKRSPHRCITAGITVGISLGVKEKEVPRYMHHNLFQELRLGDKPTECGGSKDSKCLRLVSNPELGAIRSRTPTSAGMRGVATEEEDFHRSFDRTSYINRTTLELVLHRDFNTGLDAVIKANQYLRMNLAGIVADNLRGQCTKGHSCKQTTKDALESLLNTTNTFI